MEIILKKLFENFESEIDSDLWEKIEEILRC